MGVVYDITQSWRSPAALIRGKTVLPREDRAFATLMGACLLMFLAQWPLIARQAALDPAIPLEARIGGSLMAVVFILPLVMYALAAASHGMARLFGGKGSGFGARMALFQALLAASPLFLAYGLSRGLLGTGGVTVVVGVAAIGGFLWVWISMLRAVEGGM
jgi:hypothetical protein